MAFSCWRGLAYGRNSRSYFELRHYLIASRRDRRTGKVAVTIKVATTGRSPDWLKMKNPEASAVKREAEEEWGNKKRR